MLIITIGLSRLLKGPSFRALSLLVLFCSILTVAVPSAHAGYEWCSVDPLFTFQRKGTLTGRPVDVQVMVPLSQIPYEPTAALNVTLPENVTGTVVLDTSVPMVFELESSIASTARPALLGKYPVKFGLMVPTPAGSEPFDIQLVITDLHSHRIQIVPGQSGRLLQKTIRIAW